MAKLILDESDAMPINSNVLTEDIDDDIIDITSSEDDEEEHEIEKPEIKKDSVNLTSALSDAMKGIISALIKDEWDAYDGYTSSIATFESEGITDEAINVLKDIANEELIHIGQLQKLLGVADVEIPKKIEDGSDEAKDQLDGEPIEEPKEEESLKESAYIGNAKVVSVLPKIGDNYGHKDDVVIDIKKVGSKDGFDIYDIKSQNKESRDKKLGDDVDVSHWSVALKLKKE